MTPRQGPPFSLFFMSDIRAVSCCSSKLGCLGPDKKFLCRQSGPGTFGKEFGVFCRSGARTGSNVQKAKVEGPKSKRSATKSSDAIPCTTAIEWPKPLQRFAQFLRRCARSVYIFLTPFFDSPVCDLPS